MIDSLCLGGWVFGQELDTVTPKHGSTCIWDILYNGSMWSRVVRLYYVNDFNSWLQTPAKPPFNTRSPQTQRNQLQ